MRMKAMAPPRTFNAMPRKSNYPNAIARHLQAAILSGEFAAGAKLPGQRDLAAQFKTSLPTIREAIGILAATGMIEVRHGHGTIIRGTSKTEGALKGWLGMAINDQERAEFLEARSLLETFIVEQIVQRPGIDFVPLEAALQRMAGALDDPKAYLEADLAFHLEMAWCAGNSVLVRMLEAIQLPMRQQIEGAIRQHLDETNGLDRSFQAHVSLVKALRARVDGRARGIIQLMINRSAAKAPSVPPNG